MKYVYFLFVKKKKSEVSSSGYRPSPCISMYCCLGFFVARWKQYSINSIVSSLSLSLLSLLLYAGVKNVILIQFLFCLEALKFSEVVT